VKVEKSGLCPRGLGLGLGLGSECHRGAADLKEGFVEVRKTAQDDQSRPLPFEPSLLFAPAVRADSNLAFPGS
jgi:hypothetical protein